MNKTLKIILIAIVAIVAIIVVMGLTMSGDYAVERQVTIKQPKQLVFDYLKMLKNQDNFSEWATMDPNMKKEFTGTDGTVGFVSAWDSEMEDVGKGEQEIKGITEGERIDYELRFLKPFEATDKAYISTEADADGNTIVKWGFTGSMAFPMNLMLPFMGMEENLGGSLQKGLDKLKTILEAIVPEPEVIETPGDSLNPEASLNTDDGATPIE